MASSKDFEKLWEMYQTAGVPNKISIVRFCEMNGIVYKHFERWYKRTHCKKVYPVEVEDAPEEDTSSLPEQTVESVKEEEKEDTTIEKIKSINYIEIKLSDGMEIRQENIDYQSLMNLVEKLEVLC